MPVSAQSSTLKKIVRIIFHKTVRWLENYFHNNILQKSTALHLRSSASQATRLAPLATVREPERRGSTHPPGARSAPPTATTCASLSCPNTGSSRTQRSLKPSRFPEIPEHWYHRNSGSRSGTSHSLVLQRGSKYALLRRSTAQENPPRVAETPGSRVSYTGSTFWPTPPPHTLQGSLGNRSPARSLLGSPRLHFEQNQASNTQVFSRQGSGASQPKRAAGWSPKQRLIQSKAHSPSQGTAKRNLTLLGEGPTCWKRWAKQQSSHPPLPSELQITALSSPQQTGRLQPPCS